MKTKENYSPSEAAKFGLGGAILYGINVVLGSGILLLPKTIYADLGPASIIAMALCTGLVFLLALCFAEVAGYFDKNGGAYQYARASFGEKTAFVIGFLSWFTVTVVWSASASGLSEILGVTFPILEPFTTPLAVIIIIFLTFINLAGIKTVKIFTITVTIAKVVPMVLVGIIGIFFIRGGFQAGNWTPFVQTAEGSSVAKAMASTAMTVFYAFVGFESLPIVAGEIRNAKKNVPIAIIVSLLITSSIYILLIATSISMLGPNLLDSSAPIQEAFAKIVGPWGYWFVALSAIVSLAGLNVGDSTHSPRMLEAIADSGALPKIIAYKDKNGTPKVAIIITAIVAALFALTGSFEVLASLSVVFYFFQYIPTCYSVLVLRKKLPGVKDQYRVPGGMIIPILAIGVSVWMILADSLNNVVIALAGIIIAVVVYYLLQMIKHKRQGQTDSNADYSETE